LGSQYCSVDYQALLHKHGILISLSAIGNRLPAWMSGCGNCYDNSRVEAFFKTGKSKLIWPVAWQSRQQAENAVARYINGFYDPVRWHSSLGHQSSIAFDRKARKCAQRAPQKSGMASHLCRLMGVSERGLHVWKHRLPPHLQRRDRGFPA
jgi:putative transposase